MPAKLKSPAKKSPGAKSSSAASEVLHPDLLTFTIQARTGQIVKIESVDSTGAHHELSDEEKTNLAKEKSKATLEDMLEQAVRGRNSLRIRGCEQRRRSTGVCKGRGSTTSVAAAVD